MAIVAEHAPDLAAELAELRAENAQLRERVAALQDALYTERRAYYQLKADHKGLIDERDELRQDVEQLEVDNERLTREHGKCGKLRDSLQRQMDQLDEALRGKQQTGDPEMVSVPVEELAELRRKAGPTDELQAKLTYLRDCATDPRLKDYKDIVAAIADVVGVPPPDGSFTEPKRVSHADITKRTGLSDSTISLKLPHLEEMGILKVDAVETVKPGARRTENWIRVGPLPDGRLNAQQIRALCHQADAKRGRKKRCPRCTSERLVATMVRCLDCGAICTAAEATAAGSAAHAATVGAAVLAKGADPGLQNSEPYTLKDGLQNSEPTDFRLACDFRRPDHEPQTVCFRCSDCQTRIGTAYGRCPPCRHRAYKKARLPEPSRTSDPAPTDVLPPPAEIRGGGSSLAGLQPPSEQHAAEGGNHCSDCDTPIPEPAIGVGRCASCRQRAYAELGLEDTS